MTMILVKNQDKEYALKIINCEDEQNIPKKLMEGNISQSLRHKSKNICPVYGCFYQKFEVPYVYILMDYYIEGSLEAELKLLKSTKTYISEYQILLWMVDIVNGIEEIHNSQIIHRDLKPDNLVLDNGHLRIIDFGEAKFRPSLDCNTRLN